VIGKKLEMLERRTTKRKKDIENNLGERRTRTRNGRTKMLYTKFSVIISIIYLFIFFPYYYLSPT